MEHGGRCEWSESGAIAGAVTELIVAVNELPVGGQLLESSQLDRIDRLLFYGRALGIRGQTSLSLICDCITKILISKKREKFIGTARESAANFEFRGKIATWNFFREKNNKKSFWSW